jgi:hypothetical protein
MMKMIAIAGFSVAVLGSLPAHAQEGPAELEGAPGSHATVAPPPLKVPPKPPVTKPAAADKTKAEQARLSHEAELQKSQQVRLARQADELKVQQAKLDLRSAELAAEEKRIEKLRADAAAQQAAEDRRLAQLRAETQAKLAAQQAELTQKQQEAARTAALAESRASAARQADADAAKALEGSVDSGGAASRTVEEPGRASSPRLIFVAARRACTWAGEQAARARDYEGALYDDEPRLYQRDGWELRGRMRLQERRGYRLVDTVCEVDDAGEVERFALLR